ncbi:MAG: hypothetical protein HOP12_12360 [Candidatus Eisenbacteria bacterium]|uniref:SGNH/GDSL hydrolase family protein n=1 Tax=Eiseniibacteriota bacterium TaxID=2212470 RepID=A0A849SPW5_UNCEI|nr:hypothetical protein [Candidatus Eisenbacteria bacterium]
MRFKNACLIAGAALIVAGCSTIDPLSGPDFNSGSADFTTYVALGTSLADGVESGGSVDRHQINSYASLFARQLGVTTFDREFINGDGLSLDGLSACLEIKSLSPVVLISAAGRTLGAPTNLAFAGDFHNLGVPGALVSDVFDTTTYYHPARANAHFAFVLRHRGSIEQTLTRLSPSFVSFEYGANEMIGRVTGGSGIPVLNSAQFGFALNAALDTVETAAPNANFALFNVPDPTIIPFATTFSPVTRDNGGNIVSLRVQTSPADTTPGSGTTIGIGGRVLLTAGPLLATGRGFPVGSSSYITGAPGTGVPLPDAVVLTSAEVANLRNELSGYNAAIAAQAAARGMALVDLAGVFQRAATTGLTWNGRTYTTAFITGGLFSLDGVHPTDQGYGFLANVLIDAVNARYGSNIQRVNIESLTATNSSLRIERGDEGPIYPLIENAPEVYRRMFPLPPGME